MSTVSEDLAALDRALAGDPLDAELAAIVSAVNTDRLDPSPGFRRALDARVAARFPRLNRRPSRGWVLGGGAASAVAAGLAVVIVIAGGPPGGSGPSTTSRPATPAPAVAGSSGSRAGQLHPSLSAQGPAGSASAPQVLTSRDQAAPAGTSGAQVTSDALRATPGPAPQTRRVQRDASLTLATEAGRLESVSREITAAVDRSGGVVQRSSVTADGGASSQATFEVSIPSRNLEPALTAISALGHVRSRTQNTQDVTDTHNALRAALSEAYAERQGLLRQLAAAASPNATASIRSRLGLLAGRISGLRSQERALAQTTDNARVAITLLAAQAASGSGSWTLGDAADEALRVLVVCAGVLLVALAVLGPLALAAGGVLLLRRRRRERALDAAV